ncbi:hypothetical protein KIW84_055940 [Lathyrus oleraceus]|uniref:Quinolinate synthase, chloroplastic n=1 Tax=Pisum sativum TaxID=3888 RepID=A0A9D4WZW2_PEA|nr:hypothetical protein KIW84_055940 [Pisum sativum]
MSTPFQSAQPAQSSGAFSFSNFGQTQPAGASSFGGTPGMFGRNNFGLQAAPQNYVVAQAAPITNPFGTLPALPQMSIGRVGTTPSVQYGISSIPTPARNSIRKEVGSSSGSDTADISHSFVDKKNSDRGMPCSLSTVPVVVPRTSELCMTLGASKIPDVTTLFGQLQKQSDKSSILDGCHAHGTGEQDHKGESGCNNFKQKQSLQEEARQIANESPGNQQGEVGESNVQINCFDSDQGGLIELEKLLKQKTFTRSEIDHLTALMQSRTVDAPIRGGRRLENCWFFDNNFNGVSEEILSDVVVFYFPLDDDVETDVVEQDWNDQFKHIEEPSLGVFSVPSFDLCGETQNEKPNLVNNFSASELSDIDRRNIVNSSLKRLLELNMAKAGCKSITVLGVDFISKNVRAILDQVGFNEVDVYRMSNERIGCSLADAAATSTYMEYLEPTSRSTSLHVMYINTKLETKAYAHELVPTITCTSSNIIQTILQAFAQVPDLSIYYGPDSYMGANIVELFQQMTVMTDEEIAAIHPEHNVDSIKSLLPRLYFYQDGSCIVHHLFGHEVVDMIKEMYCDAFLTVHLEVPKEMFSLAMEAKRRGMGVVGSTQNILDFIKDKVQESLDRNIDDHLQFVLGTESGMVTAIVAAVRSLLEPAKSSSHGAKVTVEIVFSVSSDSISKTTSSLNSVEVSDIIPLVVPGVTSGEGCSIHGGCASCPYMKMNSLSSLLTVCHHLPDEENMLSAYKAERFKLQTPNGQSVADGHCVPDMKTWEDYEGQKQLNNEVVFSDTQPNSGTIMHEAQINNDVIASEAWPENELTNSKTTYCGEEYSKLDRKVLFDYVSECLESRCDQAFVGSCKSWPRWVTSIQRKNILAEELYKEMLSFRNMKLWL